MEQEEKEQNKAVAMDFGKQVLIQTIAFSIAIIIAMKITKV